MSDPTTIRMDDYPVADSTDVADTVPVIDLGHAAGDNVPQPVIEQIADACREWGFFQVINHDIPDKLVGRNWQQTRRFFALPVEQKEQLIRNKANPWGYYNRELTKNSRDKKEVFDYTSEVKGTAGNRWPETNSAMRSVMLEYFDACTNLAMTLLNAVSQGLGLAPDYLARHFSPEHTSFVRLNHYPIHDPLLHAANSVASTAGLGIHHHSDAGALTLLLQDEVGGLQVFRDGYWHNVASVPGAYVINTGDMLQVWSNDRYRAPLHRVLAMEELDRYSIPYFFNPSVHTVVRPLPMVIADNDECRYKSIKWADFRSQRADGDYADYGTEVQISQFRIQ